MQIGRGVTMSGTSANWQSGTLESSGNVTDLAINGKGMFIVQDPGGGGQFYTRAGQFEFDLNGFLVNTDGMRVQGYPIDPATGATGSLGDISMPQGMSDPNPTTEMTMSMNLDAGAAVDDSFDTTITTYDSLGNPVELFFVFTKTVDVPATWEYAVTPSVTGASATPDAAAPGTLTFDDTGAFSGTTPQTISVTGLGAAADMSLAWNDIDINVSGYAGDSVKTAQTQDGYPSGMLQGISVDENGVFTGLYSNGSMIPFSQIALADFASYSGLAKQSSNLFTSSLSSGQPIISAPNTAGVGGIAPSSLEMSNVDLATEFVELITTQRAFQANSKVISTSDEVLAELINIKR
jgi:flagellar hook protein FlgE